MLVGTSPRSSHCLVVAAPLKAADVLNEQPFCEHAPTWPRTLFEFPLIAAAFGVDQLLLKRRR